MMRDVLILINPCLTMDVHCVHCFAYIYTGVWQLRTQYAIRTVDTEPYDSVC